MRLLATVAFALLSLVPVSTHAQFPSWLTSRAEYLAPYAPPLQWQLSLGEYEREYVDELMMVGAQQVLVGITDGPYVMLDAASGNVVWRHNRDRPSEGYRILSAEPVILVAHTEGDDHRIMALDAQSGRRVWRDEGDTSRVLAISPDGTALLVAERERSGLALRLLDVTNGQALWNAATSVGSAEVPELFVTDSAVVVVGSTVSAFSRGDGTPSWSHEGLGPVPKSSYSMMYEDGFLVPGPQGQLTRLAGHGAVLWRVNLSGEVGAIFTQGGSIVVQTRAAELGHDAVSHLFPETGEVLWTASVGGRLMSNLLITEGKLVLTRFDRDTYLNSVDVLDMTAGERVWSARLPLCGANRLADVLVAFPGKITLAQEKILSSYSLDTGDLLWRHELNWTQGYAWAQERLAAERGHFEDLVARLEGKDPDAARPHVFPDMDLDQTTFRDFWRRQQAYTFSSTQPTLRSGSGASGWERRYAHFSRLNAITAARVNLEIEQAFSRMEANVNILLMGIELANALTRARIQGYIEETRTDLENVRGSLRSALSIHASMIQGVYYIHPVVHPSHPSDAHEPVEQRDWWGHVVVDMETGRWSQAISSVSQERFLSFLELDYEEQRGYANQFATLSPDGLRIVSRGIGLDPDRWKRLKRGNETISYPSILSIAVDDLEFHEPAEFPSQTGYGFIDTTGSFVAAPVFAETGSHSSGRALAQCSGFRGFVNREGEFTVPPRYKWVLPYSDSVAAVQEFDLQYRFVDVSGREIAGGKKWRWVDQFVDGLAPARVGEVGDKSGFIGKDGEWVIGPIYDGARAFSEGVAAVEDDDEWLFIDRTGAVVIERGLRDGSQFSDWISSWQCLNCIVEGKRWEWPSREGLIIISKDGKSGYMNHLGQVVITPEYYSAESFSEGRAAVKLSNESSARIGFIDTTGTVVIPPAFRRASAFSQGLAAVQLESYQWGFVNREGLVVIDSLEEAGSFAEGLAPVAIEQDRLHSEFGLSDPLGGPVWGYINREGEFVIPPQFRDAGPFSEGLAWARPLERPLVPTPQGDAMDER